MGPRPLPSGDRDQLKASVGVLVLVFALALQQVAAQETPQLSDGRPDLNGIWQVLNEANYDLEPHMARHSLQLREGPVGPVPSIPTLRMGAVGAGPGSLGVIVGGGKIPYTAAARGLKEENAAHWIDRDPEVKCYLPGVPRATIGPFGGWSNIVSGTAWRSRDSKRYQRCTFISGVLGCS